MAQPRFKSNTASATDGTTFASASITPANARRYTIAIASVIAAGTPNTPTLTGTNGWLAAGYTQIATAVQDQLRLTLFKAIAVSAVAGVITADFAGQTNSGFAFLVDEWTDVNTAFDVQNVTQSINGAAALDFATPLAAFASTLNGTYVVQVAAGSLLALRALASQGTMMQLPPTPATSTEINISSYYSPGAVLAPSLISSGTPDQVGIAIEVSNSLSAGGLIVVED